MLHGGYDGVDTSTSETPGSLRRLGKQDPKRRVRKFTLALNSPETSFIPPFAQQKQTTARLDQSLSKSQTRKGLARIHSQQSARIQASHDQQIEEVSAVLNRLRLRQQGEEARLREQLKIRDKLVWERIEGVIRVEEERVRIMLEAERRKREEEERKKREIEERRRVEEEKKRLAVEQAKREAEEKRKQEEVQRQQEELERQEAEKKAELLKAEEKERNSLGMSTGEQDWKRAREILKVRLIIFFTKPLIHLLLL